jgi:ABC-type nitrate/sulfonate/bicarbonate transport system substrate-binding protein
MRLLALLLLPSLAAASESVSFFQDGFPGAQFAGVYVAADHGFYRDAGLDVAVHAFSFGQDMAAQVGNVPSPALGSADARWFLEKRAGGADLVALNAVLRESPYGFMGLGNPPAGSGRAFAGRRVGVHRGDEPFLRFFLRRAGLSESAATIVPVDDNVGRLERGEVDLMEGNACAEGVRLRRDRGDASGFISYRALGYDAYDGVLFTTRQQLSDHSDALRAFVDATRQGWTYAVAHPGEAADSVAARLGPEADRERVLRELTATLPFVSPAGRAPLGPMDPAKWSSTEDACVQMGLLARAEPPDRLMAGPQGLISGPP